MVGLFGINGSNLIRVKIISWKIVKRILFLEVF